MKPAPFEYHAPRTIEDAVALLARLAPEEARVIAGGQTLVPAMAMRLARPGHLIDINAVPGLDRLAIAGGMLHIGACVRHAALGPGAAPGPLGRLLARMQRHIAHAPIRARGTVCGSLANADPASEWCLAAIALGGALELRSTRGIRTIPAATFCVGTMATLLEPDEIITSLALPLLPEGARAGFYEFSRRAGDFAQVMALAICGAAPTIIAVGALEPVARRLPQAEAAFTGAAAIPAAARAAAAALHGVDDYQRALCQTAVTRALAEASA